MVCALCGEVKKSDPEVESNWWLMVDGPFRRYYCTGHDVQTITEHFVRLVAGKQEAE